MYENGLGDGMLIRWAPGPLLLKHEHKQEVGVLLHCLGNPLHSISLTISASGVLDLVSTAPSHNPPRHQRGKEIPPPFCFKIPSGGFHFTSLYKATHLSLPVDHGLRVAGGRAVEHHPGPLPRRDAPVSGHRVDPRRNWNKQQQWNSGT